LERGSSPAAAAVAVRDRRAAVRSCGAGSSVV
jgi:hypothetical protein